MAWTRLDQAFSRGVSAAWLACAAAASALAPALGAQEKPVQGLAGPPPPLRDQLRLYYTDRTVAVVGEEVITERDVIGHIQSGRLENDPLDEETGLSGAQLADARFEAALRELIDQRLKASGGRSLGFDAELISRAVDNEVVRFIERQGGEQRAAASFERMGLTRSQLRAIYEQRMLEDSWEATVTGRGPGGTGRNVVDSYIRPGKRYARYREFAASRTPEKMALVGKSRGELTLRQLAIALPPGSEPSESRRRLEALRERILDGTLSFGDVVQRVSPPVIRGEQGYLRGFTPDEVRRVLSRQHPDGGEELAAFCASATVGELSPVLPWTQNGEIQAFTVYRIEGYEGAKDPLPFFDRALQQQLDKAIREEREEVQIYRGLARLARTSHVAPEGLREWLLSRGKVQARGSGGAGEGGQNGPDAGQSAPNRAPGGPGAGN